MLPSNSQASSSSSTSFSTTSTANYKRRLRSSNNNQLKTDQAAYELDAENTLQNSKKLKEKAKLPQADYILQKNLKKRKIHHNQITSDGNIATTIYNDKKTEISLEKTVAKTNNALKNIIKPDELLIKDKFEATGLVASRDFIEMQVSKGMIEQSQENVDSSKQKETEKDSTAINNEVINNFIDQQSKK